MGLELHENLKEEHAQKCKFFFILRDQFLLTKVSVTGTVVFYLKKESRHFFGIDDSTGVVTCVLWLNDYNNSRGAAASSRQSDLRNWLFNEDVKIGDTMTILGGLESFRDKL